MKNLLNKVLFFVACVLLFIPISLAVDDNSVFDVSSCANQTSLSFRDCGIFSGHLDGDNLFVPSRITFQLDTTYTGDSCQIEFGLNSGTISSLRLNGVILPQVNSNTFSNVTITPYSTLIIQGSNVNISSYSISCLSETLSLTKDVIVPTLVQEDKSLVITSQTSPSKNGGELVETHTFFPVDSSYISLTTMAFPTDICSREYSGQIMTITCIQTNSVEPYQIIMVPLRGFTLQHSYEATYTFGVDSAEMLSSNSDIEVISRPSATDVGVSTRLTTGRGIITPSELSFNDIIYSAEVACPTASSVSLVIGNVFSGVSCEYFSNERLPNGYFAVRLNDDSLINDTYCDAPFTVSRSGLYEIESSCNYNASSGICSGACLQPFPSSIPATFGEWVSLLSFGRTFFDFFNDNEIADCVCGQDNQLEPINTISRTENLSVSTGSSSANTQPRISMNILTPLTDGIVYANNFTLRVNVTCESDIACTNIELELPLNASFEVLSGSQTETINLNAKSSVIQEYLIGRMS